jgi:hypothetical protein
VEEIKCLDEADILEERGIVGERKEERLWREKMSNVEGWDEMGVGEMREECWAFERSNMEGTS